MSWITDITALLKFPNIGELLLKRLVIQFRRGFKRNDKSICISAATFIAHLVNQRVAHEIIALEILTLLVESPTDDSVEVAIAFLKECGMKLMEVSNKGIHAIFEMLRNILHEGQLDKRVQYMIEVIFQVRKDNFRDHEAITEDLDLVEEADQFTHLITLDEATDPDDILNVFKFDAEYEDTEAKYLALRKEILDEGSGSSGDESGSESGSDEEESGNGLISSHANRQVVSDASLPHSVKHRRQSRCADWLAVRVKPPLSTVKPQVISQLPGLISSHANRQVVSDASLPHSVKHRRQSRCADWLAVRVKPPLSTVKPQVISQLPEEAADTTILDNTETNLVALRRTIYLTIHSSLDFEECAHKLMRMELKPGQEMEMCHMFLDCCAEQRTYEKFFGLLAQHCSFVPSVPLAAHSLNEPRLVDSLLFCTWLNECAETQSLEFSLAQPKPLSNTTDLLRSSLGRGPLFNPAGVIGCRRRPPLQVIKGVRRWHISTCIGGLPFEPRVPGLINRVGTPLERFCQINRTYIPPFQQILKDTYDTIHRLDTNKLRNVAKFFAHLLFTDAISWEVLSFIRLNEEETTSSSRIFIKILFQELSEYMGLTKLNNRVKDPTLQMAFDGLFPRDNPKNTRFAINFFTSIGLGGLTDELREHLKSQPKAPLVPQLVEALGSGSNDSENSSDDSSSDSSSESEPEPNKKDKRKKSKSSKKESSGKSKKSKHKKKKSKNRKKKKKV
uniref:MI domain-containing protein n=2 Tax=Timema TaxID=61471 RepID=A0A7R9PRI2_TIMGE|nr:unnamed protein product [Timema genevievae]